MTVQVPCDNAEKVGLRYIIDEETVQLVVKALTGGSTEMPKNWNRRFKHNRDKMKTGDIFELAEVVRTLLRDHEKGLDRREADVREGEEDPRLRAHGTPRISTRTARPRRRRPGGCRERQGVREEVLEAKTAAVAA